MNTLGARLVLAAVALSAPLALTSAAEAGCRTWEGYGRSYDEHQARQEAIYEANIKFNAWKGSQLSNYNTADRLNRAIDRGRLSTKVRCRGNSCVAKKRLCW